MDLTPIVEKLEEIRCCVIDVETAIEKIAAQISRSGGTEKEDDAGKDISCSCGGIRWNKEDRPQM